MTKPKVFNKPVRLQVLMDVTEKDSFSEICYKFGTTPSAEIRKFITDRIKKQKL